MVLDFLESYVIPYSGSLRELLDSFPFFTQCIFISAMSLERWLFVCQPVFAKHFFSQTKKKLAFYCGTSVLALSIPSVLVADYVKVRGWQVKSVKNSTLFIHLRSYPTLIIRALTLSAFYIPVSTLIFNKNMTQNLKSSIHVLVEKFKF